MRDALQASLEKRINGFVAEKAERLMDEKDERKIQACADRNAVIVKTYARGKILRQQFSGERQAVLYEVHFQHLIKQKEHLYLEEEVEVREANFQRGMLEDDSEVVPDQLEAAFSADAASLEMGARERLSYVYDRRKAVQYAERWWNSYNPAFKKFDVDCTNYISQCLHAGGAPMRGYPNRGQGWWMRGNNYSYSWAVANSLRWYLAGSKTGLKAREVGSPDELIPGDVICYDFQGDGRFDHNTIVVAKDANGMPLVNAHTYNSRMRYWEYTDSSAYTPKIKYKFYTILDESREWL
ncbi:amidase domain-containing protein [Neobacillus sp. YIM B06451]|uniref:amidase domain-containing protein n=1 Tax=Neobacillus sp. YIM B06451 TaxID=3070994 RepID=UPI0029313D67|nr:amidase domain-containing protein [Neobacillus sp. YIM B06451]